jgi:hypothetical protein
MGSERRRNLFQSRVYAGITCKGENKMQQTSGTGQKQELNSAAAEAGYLGELLFPGTMQFIRTLMTVIIIFLGWFALPLELLTHHRFGDRYLGWFRVSLSFLSVSAVYMGITTIALLPSLMNSNRSSAYLALGGIFGIGFWILGLYHLLAIWLRNRSGMIWHSRSNGISLLRYLNIPQAVSLWGFRITWADDWSLMRFFEPLICLGVSLLLAQVFLPLGGTLIVASVALLLRSNLAYHQLRNRILDMADAQIEAQCFTAALNGASKQKTAGVPVVRSTQLRKLVKMRQNAPNERNIKARETAVTTKSEAWGRKTAHNAQMDIPPVDESPTEDAWWKEISSDILPPIPAEQPHQTDQKRPRNIKPG